MTKINFALIGCGRIAHRHAENILKFANLLAVCDSEKHKADEFAEQYQCQAYYTIEDLLKAQEEVNIVSICTPNGLHAKHSILALNYGKHVLCEKPMAINVYDCGEMIKTAEKNNKRLFVIKQNRFNPPVAAVKSLIENNQLGKIYSVQLNCFWNRNEDYYKNSWKGTLQLDGGTLFTQFSHFVDLLYWFFGDVRDSYAFADNFHHKDVIEFEDTGVVILKFYSGVLGTINYTVNSYKKNMEGSITIFAEKGTVKIGGQYLNELEYQLLESGEITNLPQGNKPNNYGEYQGSMSNHDSIFRNVVNVLQNNAAISTNMFEGLKTVEIIDKIYTKIRG
ncbi:MAG: Gfo/Idh/MocA family oxidoreductase [Bacteroidia bacterium]|nr:Gfo/Idh/MocA family oxidoreductase [Bacteroidia bacterium]